MGQCKLHVLNQTPAVLSIGSRCTKEGYSFVWPEGADIKPVMINEEGTCTFLEVDGDIPYLIPNDTPEDDVIRENPKKLVKHLESLIHKLKSIDDEEDDINPKAKAGEESDVELFEQSDRIQEDPDAKIGAEEEPHKRDEDPRKVMVKHHLFLSAEQEMVRKS